MEMRKGVVGFGAVALVIVSLMLGGEGARMMKEEQHSYRPQNFIAAGGFIPTTPGTPGFATGFGFGPSGFCAFPGSCSNIVPGGIIGDSSSSAPGDGVGSLP